MGRNMRSVRSGCIVSSSQVSDSNLTPCFALIRSHRLKRIPSIDGLRAISIFFVIVGHLAPSIRQHHHFGAFGNLMWELFGNGFLGVSIFFVISGYLITTLLLREYDRTATISLSDFYFRRTFRIFPPLYAYILFIAITAHWTGLAAPTSEILVALTFTRNLIFHPHIWQFEHFWSLCIEEQFYLLWPLLLIWALKKGGKALASKIAVALIVIAPILRVASFFLIHQQETRHDILSTLPCLMDALMFGCLMALTQGTPVFEAIYQKAARVIWIFPIFVWTVSNLVSWHLKNYYTLPIGITLDGISISLFLIWCARNAQSAVGKFLNWAPIVHIGVVSYSIYIWQTFFLHPNNTTLMGRFPLNLVFILLAAEISWFTIERWSRTVRDALEPLFFRERSRIASKS